jgi:2-polyprenyl-3-methyl-5-hydroxy-6-metoxy-1,4-benzoquinol methylase
MTQTPNNTNTPQPPQQACFICGNPNWQLLYKAQDLLHDLDGNFWLYECPECGLVSTQPKLSNQAMKKYYPEDYIAYPIAVDDEKTWHQRADRQRGVRRRCDFAIRESGMATGKVLDVGCATGVFLKGMQNRGWQAFGIEPSDYAAHYAQERLNLDVKHDYLQADSYESNQFDLVTLWDVFEHLPNPEETLQIIHNILKPGGVLLLGLPNPESWDRYWFKDAWSGWDVPRHYYVYKTKALTRLLKKHGFRFKRIKSFTGRHGAMAISFDFWFKKKGLSEKKRRRFSKFFHSYAVRVLTLPYFYFADALNRSAGMTVTYIKE